MDLRIEGGEEGKGGIYVRGRGLATHANYSTKRGGFFLVINGRLVECSPLR